MDFGKKVQMLRKSHNISQEELANILNVNRNNLSRVETGKSEPSLSTIRNIANYFGVDVATLIGIDENKMTTKEKIKEINDGCKYLIDDDLDFLIRLISVMRNEYVKKQ